MLTLCVCVREREETPAANTLRVLNPSVEVLQGGVCVCVWIYFKQPPVNDIKWGWRRSLCSYERLAQREKGGGGGGSTVVVRDWTMTPGLSLWVLRSQRLRVMMMSWWHHHSTFDVWMKPGWTRSYSDPTVTWCQRSLKRRADGGGAESGLICCQTWWHLWMRIKYYQTSN